MKHAKYQVISVAVALLLWADMAAAQVEGARQLRLRDVELGKQGEGYEDSVPDTEQYVDHERDNDECDQMSGWLAENIDDQQIQERYQYELYMNCMYKKGYKDYVAEPEEAPAKPDTGPKPVAK